MKRDERINQIEKSLAQAWRAQPVGEVGPDFTRRAMAAVRHDLSRARLAAPKPGLGREWRLVVWAAWLYNDVQFMAAQTAAYAGQTLWAAQALGI